MSLSPYNTPAYAGFDGSLSVSQGGNVDMGLHYGQTFGSVEVAGALGHKIINNQTTAAANVQKSSSAASLSAKHQSRLGASIAYMAQSLDNKSNGVENPEGYYGKVGYEWDAYGIAAEYGKFKNPVAVATDHEMDVYGVGAEWNMGHGVTAGVLYRNFSADVTGVTNIEDIDIYTATLRVKF